MGRTRRRRRAGIATVLSLGLLAALPLAAMPAAQAVTLVQDPDRNSSAVTPWGWHTNVSAATVTAFVNQGNRIIDLEVNSSTPTFSVAYVANAGTYGRSWWWYYGISATQVNSYLSTNNARLIDVEPYVLSSGQLRFAVVMVSNTGAAAKAWQWWYGQSVAGISSHATSFGGRPIDIDRYSTSAGDRFAVILIKNTGVDAKGWWHYYNVTPAQIATYLNTNHARLIDIERVSSTGRYDVVMQSAGSEYWWWYYGQSTTSLANLASQLGARIYKIEPYVVGSTRYFAALLINDVNAETTRIRNLVDGPMAGSWGFYVKKVGGSDVLGLQPDRIFEPASMIKAIHHAHAMKQAYNGVAGSALTDNVIWYANPAEPARYPSSPNYANPDGTLNDPADKDVCAYNSSGILLTGATYSDDLGPVILKQMMEQSDNRTTDAVVRKYGFTALNATADTLGMTRSHLYHRVGCDSDSVPAWKHNELTLRDIGRLYERVENGTWVGTGSFRTTFWSYMVDGGIGSTSTLANMIRSEALAAGLTNAQATDFISRIKTASKGGSYGQCPDGGGACNPPTLQSRTVGGIMWIPFKNTRGGVVQSPYVYGRFFNTVVNCTFNSVNAGSCSSFNSLTSGMNTVSVEMWRAVIKQAVATW